MENWFQFIFPNFLAAVLRSTALCIPLRNILRKGFVTTVLTLLTHALQSHTVLCVFFAMMQKQFCRVFQLFASAVKQFYQKNTWKNSQIIFT